MPQLLAAALIAAAGVTAGTVAAYAITLVVYLAFSYATSWLLTKIMGTPGAKPSDIQVTIKQAVGSRRRGYGITHVGGQLTFEESRNGTLYKVITTGHGEIAEILQHRFNNKPRTVSGDIVSGYPSPYNNVVRLYWNMGTDTQAAFSALTSAFSQWTANHRQRGCNNVLLICQGVKAKNFSDVYEGSKEPEYTQVRKEAKVYDPRKDSTQIIGYEVDGVTPIMGSGAHRKDNTATFEWDDNGALVTADYLAHPDGFGLGWDAINWTNVAEEADVCDAIPYRIWGTYSLVEDERRNVLAQMQDACDMFIWQDAHLKVNMRVGRWIEPTVSITDDHILSVTGSLGVPGQQEINEVKVVYTEATQDYRETESDPIIDQDAQDRDGPASQRFDIYYIPSNDQAVRIAKRILHKSSSSRWNLSLVTNLVGLNCVGERNVRITLPDLGIDNLAFEIVTLRINFFEGMVEMTLLEIQEDDWSPPLATGPVFGDDTWEPRVIGQPSDLYLNYPAYNIGTQLAPKLVASWTANADREDLEYQAQYRPVGETEWVDMTVSDDGTVAEVSTVEDGTEYEVRVRSTTLNGMTSDWTTPVAATADVAIMQGPVGSDGSSAGGSNFLSWRNPPQDTYEHTDIYRNSVNDYDTATKIATAYGAPSQDMEYEDAAPLAGTNYYWIICVDISGVKRSPNNSPISVDLV